MAVAVDGTHRHDMKLVEATLTVIPVPRPVQTDTKPLYLYLDKGATTKGATTTRRYTIWWPPLPQVPPQAPIGGLLSVQARRLLTPKTVHTIELKFAFQINI